MEHAFSKQGTGGGSCCSLHLPAAVALPVSQRRWAFQKGGTDDD